MDYYSATKENEIMSFAGKWMDHQAELDKVSSKGQILHILMHCGT
jgi:hypothetical protein